MYYALYAIYMYILIYVCVYISINVSYYPIVLMYLLLKYLFPLTWNLLPNEAVITSFEQVTNKMSFSY